MTIPYSNSDEARSRTRTSSTKLKNGCIETNTASAAIVSRKKRVRTSKQDRQKGFDIDDDTDSAPGNLDSILLTDYLVQKVRQYEPDLSIVEIEERRIPGHKPSSPNVQQGICVKLTLRSRGSLQHHCLAAPAKFDQSTWLHDSLRHPARHFTTPVLGT